MTAKRKTTELNAEKCPTCGGTDLYQGYGLMGGGIGPYLICMNDACDWMTKEREPVSDGYSTEQP